MGGRKQGGYDEERTDHMESRIHTDLYLKVEPLLNRLTVEGRRVISVFTDLKGRREEIRQ